ncbi:putative DNA-binding protein YizB [Lentibacillus sp. JNUCC-1]|uniref:PadR family transcriptional regulator n=1 Tax=Lentibacillus sp. JNUCC-1 TaxID=2654513 RepID=UPI0012E71D0E|nr:PadR family transcriptional regulator [Lentibacillus sp. JNUCC-1]MUV37594.1 putative DNA-binding protein YizB [Lentibacillus sp. JNUCC-1]
MNIQFKKGVLGICVLALLNKREHYGYELVREISAQIEISEGAVYPLLRRLKQDGYLTTYLQESIEGPPRKYYKLTEEGRQYMQTLVQEWNDFSKGVNHLIAEGVDEGE